MIIDNAIEEITKLIIKQDLNDRKSGKKEMIHCSKVELMRFCIKLLKVLKK